MNVLIAYDGSSQSEAALQDLRRAGLRGEVRARVLSVADAMLMPESQASRDSAGETAVRDVQSRALQALTASRTLAEQGAARLRAQFPSWTIEPDTCAAAPAWGIIDRAETWPAELVVLGSHGRSAVSRIWFGSVSHTVLTNLRCSVRIARVPVSAAPAPRILVATDGSQDAALAIQALLGRHWPAGTEVRVISVADSVILPLDLYAPAGLWATAPEAAEAAVADARARLDREGLSVSGYCRKGDPKREIVAEAADWKADCIFVGARGLRRIERFLLGSVSTFVAMHAPCSVEVIHPASSRTA